ncbi:hypothetical protein [Thiothrix nivea]|uniref:Uncharacterized protein n=1 Tax=Thiothrix nivea (strain ATCC 35100 / DSM 5205 / JP2) TaxID=870187 RepID=A0A656HH87_THINJ|nr:hypothetical protein [Thiothrix nivea]EIJ36381.1 hypothetical protein Thini_3881 [Thiothrix nivea DSM 5205]
MKASCLLFAVLLFIAGIQPTFADVSLQARLLLQGAYDATTGLMRDDLRSKNLLPSTQPYNYQPFNYTGAETASPDLLVREGDTAVVDWVLVELRPANGNETLLASVAAMLQRDGWLADPHSGEGKLTFAGVNPGDYRIAIRHRNHLPAISQSVALGQAATMVDFTTAVADDISRYQTQGKALLWAGDADANGRIIGSGPDTDVNTLLGFVLTEPDNLNQLANYRLDGYYNADLNLDGVTLFAGPGTDVTLLKSNPILHPSNASYSLNFVVATGNESTAVITPPVVDTATLNIARLFGAATQGADYGEPLKTPVPAPTMRK